MSINDNVLCNLLLKNVNDTKINQLVFNDAQKTLLNEYKKDLPPVSSIELGDKYNHHHSINSALYEGTFYCGKSNTGSQFNKPGYFLSLNFFKVV